MLSRTPLRAMMLIAIGALATIGACSEGDTDLTGPPIPTLSQQAAGTGVGTVDAGPMNAECNCSVWECSSSVCGYDTANPPGACCVECTTGSIPPTPKPSCDPGSGGGGGSCSEQLGAGEYKVDFCTAENPFGCSGVCPAEFVCCYGGPYGDGPF